MTDTEKREVGMYGVTVAGMRAAVEQSINVYPSHGSPEKMVISMLSDAQEMLTQQCETQMGDYMVREDVRQLLNRAKWILFNYCVQEKSEV